MIYFLHLKRFAAEKHCWLVKSYSETALSERSEWFDKFKNGKFDVEDTECSGRSKVNEDYIRSISTNIFISFKIIGNGLKVIKFKSILHTWNYGKWVHLKRFAIVLANLIYRWEKCMYFGEDYLKKNKHFIIVETFIKLRFHQNFTAIIWNMLFTDSSFVFIKR